MAYPFPDPGRAHELEKIAIEGLNVMIPRWVVKRLMYYYDNPFNTHYEPSWYGPTNSLLFSVFLTEDGFMVKPQARLRKHMSEPQSRLHTKNRPSTDSQNHDVLVSPHDDIPDFVVVRAGSDGKSDKPFLVFEVKNDDQSFEAHDKQFKRYEAWLREVQKRERNPTVGTLPLMAMIMMIGNRVKGCLVSCDPQVDVPGLLQLELEYDILSPILMTVFSELRKSYMDAVPPVPVVG